MSDNKKLYVIVPAAGVGSRMKADLPKQYLQINGKAILEHTVEKLLSHPEIEKVIVAVSDSDPYFSELCLASNPNVIRVSGGKERADSVLSALNYFDQECSDNAWALVHDAARPCVSLADIGKLIAEVQEHAVGGILAAPVRDTMKRSDSEANISSTVDRNNLWHALTPQMFRINQLKEALAKALEANVAITDEASAMEWAGLSPKLVAGRMDNIKVTQPEDLALAEFYLSREEKA
ncbi:2-C-methyl-D-erythritol 4-phosphate cytidylyltransferase [Vibrio sp. JC009]|uniref:2-C-methyl-D-erythritol 4-phosphate cytidylyltransferase n=1 Tax=Vibrio sp. JC009 TaxID=2912314 RepID=UPI0023B0BF28|nr:2-C-methyl-D-erythritol 4-phosphate cytidylyltransferase [Vibrio sp. JC009]WED21379.1 2-C-methyl-D-erythritol 4-phosphate cytidylyltransferase [Vibrio sp. JC009]